MTLCGFFIHKKLFFLGAFPDEIRTCDCCGTSTLELKCPFSLENVNNSISSLLYLEVIDGKLKLIEEHNYFYQLQLQMLCRETKFADFFVWSPRVEEGVYHKERILHMWDNYQTVIFFFLSINYSWVIREILHNQRGAQERTAATSRCRADTSKCSWCDKFCSYQWRYYSVNNFLLFTPVDVL